MSRFIKIFTSLIIILSLCGCVSQTKAFSVPFDEETSYTMEDTDLLLDLIKEQMDIMGAAHTMAESARYLGYEEGHDIILLAKTEYENANDLRMKYREVYDKLMELWHEKEVEYPTATYIWTYLKSLGYNSYVCAGILGNIMNEAGGNTLNIQFDALGSGFYGICQWNKAYSDVWGTSLEEQCNYLRDTIEYEIDTFGYAYKKDFNYASFLELTDVEKVAKAFAKCYERCSSESYYTRQQNAITAYNYFIS